MLMTAGPFRPVRLEVSNAYIDSVRIDYELSDNLSTVSGSVKAQVSGMCDRVVLSMRLDGNEVFSTTESVNPSGKATLNFKLSMCAILGQAMTRFD